MDACDLGAITLTRRATPTRTLSVSLPEAVAWFAGEQHSDRPHCVSPVLLTTATVLGGRLPHPKRQRLKRFVPSLVGTADDGHDEQRSLIAMDWLVRVYTPAWLRLVPALDLARVSLAERSPVLTVADAADAIEGPLAAVHSAAWTAYTATPWDRRDLPRSEVAATLSRILSTHAADAAVAATLDIAASFLPVCGRMRLATEQALLIAACTRHDVGASPSVDSRVTALLTPTAAALEDAVIELFGRLIEATPPTDHGWLSADPVESVRHIDHEKP
ncbi:hypothetical protein [Saccharomonospora sp.]|uniref:hypothetical protein n=1 Tax=Saccharomonospora sp. TaxID=33913 RepID=UPI002626E2DB|nr:hypothetical protein [Saccharomonospora sp.]